MHTYFVACLHSPDPTRRRVDIRPRLQKVRRKEPATDCIKKEERETGRMRARDAGVGMEP